MIIEQWYLILLYYVHFTMSLSVGIGLAFVAMLCWGTGDFLIQKSTRKFGDWETIFLITGFGAVILLPFVYKDLPALFGINARAAFWILLGTGALHLVAVLLELESLRRGKIAVMEPIWSLEILAAALFAFLILGERLSGAELFLILFLMAGLILMSFRGKLFSARHFLERGVYFAFAGALTMGAAAFFTGLSSRLTDPLNGEFRRECSVAFLIRTVSSFSRKIVTAVSRYSDASTNIDSDGRFG